MKMPEVAELARIVLALSRGGLASADLSQPEASYLERSLPFWALLHCVLEEPEMVARLCVCLRCCHFEGYPYKEAIACLLDLQSESGAFISGLEKRRGATGANRLRLLPATSAAIHALIGYQRFLEGLDLATAD